MITFTISIHGIDNLDQLNGNQQGGQPQVQITTQPAMQTPIQPLVPEPKLPKFPPPSIPETPETPDSLALYPQPVVHHIYASSEKKKDPNDNPPPLPGDFTESKVLGDPNVQ